MGAIEREFTLGKAQRRGARRMSRPLRPATALPWAAFLILVLGVAQLISAADCLAQNFPGESDLIQKIEQFTSVRRCLSQADEHEREAFITRANEAEKRLMMNIRVSAQNLVSGQVAADASRLQLSLSRARLKLLSMPPCPLPAVGLKLPEPSARLVAPKCFANAGAKAAYIEIWQQYDADLTATYNHSYPDVEQFIKDLEKVPWCPEFFRMQEELRSRLRESEKEPPEHGMVPPRQTELYASMTPTDEAVLRLVTLLQTVATIGELVPVANREAVPETERCDIGNFHRDMAMLDTLGRQAADLDTAAEGERDGAQGQLADSLGQFTQLMSGIDGRRGAIAQSMMEDMVQLAFEPESFEDIISAALVAQMAGLDKALEEAASKLQVAEPARGVLRAAMHQAAASRLAGLAAEGAREAKAASDGSIARLTQLWDAKCRQTPTTGLQPGSDVAKNDVLLIDTSTQEKIPGGQVVLIPDDPKKPIPPPLKVREDGKVTLPPLQPRDRVVFLPDVHEKMVLLGSDLPLASGSKLLVPEEKLRLIVHGTPCGQVTDALVAEGLADQYGARPAATAARGWQGAEYSFVIGDVAHQDCVVEVPRYESLKPVRPVAVGHPKDGPTRTNDGNVIEGDQPREIQGPPPLEHFATSRGSWGEAYADQWYLAAVRWLKEDGTTVLPDTATPVTVAVIDTGVDFTHPELAGANWINPSPSPSGDVYGWNFIDQTSDIRDLSGHGTIIAGIIAASSHRRFGIAGINPWARIMALKAMELDGRGGSIGLSQAIVYAVDHGARVINLSVGGPTLTKAEQDAVDYAAKRDVLVVVASGNEGIDTAKFSPAGLRNVLAVAAVGPDLKRQAFSNWGATIGIAAPGVDILSLRARQTDLLQMTRREYSSGTAVVAGQFYRVTGSSFAAPIVSGAASLLFSLKPNLTAEQVKRMLLQSARDLEKIGTNQFSGYGLLDIEAALAADPDAFAEAAISGVAVVQAQGRTVVRVLGTANADKLKQAHLEIGAGRDPNHWRPVLRPLARPVIAGVLGDIPADAFSSNNQWTLRVIVTDAKGLRREARFQLTLG